MHAIRDPEAWYESLKRWADGSVFVRMRLCNATNFPNGQSTKKDWIRFYTGHTNMIREFVKDHPSLTYIEIDIESNYTAKVLFNRIGIRSTCWKRCRPENMFCDSET